jgi:hypothetical protein
MAFRPTVGFGAGFRGAVITREAKEVPKTKKGKRAKMHKTMGEFKRGQLKSGSGQKVKSRKQAIAIGLSQSGQSKYD